MGSDWIMSRPLKLEPRKLPKQLRSKETVDAIFEAAMQVLQKSEREDPSVQSIADRAGVSVGSLYQYFPSKQSFVSALIRFHLESATAAFEKQLLTAYGLSAEEAAVRLIEEFVNSMAPRSKIELSMMQYFCRLGDLFALTQVDEQMNQAIERFLSSLGTEVRPVDLQIAAFLILNTLRSAVLLTMLQKPERISDPAFKAELVYIITRYLRP
jgi:AcrR family transcriptional regulator